MIFFYDRTRKGWPFNTGEFLIEATTWAGLTIHRSIDILYFFFISIHIILHKDRSNYNQILHEMGNTTLM